jgi:signal transduction histidine kinase
MPQRIRQVHAVLILGAGAAFAVIAYRVQIDNLFTATSPARASATVAAGLAFIVAGVIAWARRPGNRLGLLMTAAGFALLARQVRYSHNEAAFTVFFAISEFCYALVAHAVLAYPSGVVRDRFDRAFLKVTYTVTLVFPLAILLVYDGSQQLRYFDPIPRKSFVLVYGDGAIARSLQDVYAVIAYGILASTFIVLIVRRLASATPRGRRMLAPLMLAAVVAALRAVFDSATTFASPVSDVLRDYLFWWQIAGLIALPLALLAGMLRSRLARATVAELALRLEHTPPPEFRDALARALRDPSLEVAFWLPDRGEFVDADGRRVTVPPDGPLRAVTPLEHDGVPVATIIHDPALRDEPQLVEAAAAAARLALENARLHAEVLAQLAQVQESRRRIVEAGDAERLRIERDLHDGAQQRLVAAALELRRLERNVDPNLERGLERAVAQLQSALDELRDLARGVHPAVLTEEGLAAALESLADRTPVPVTLVEVPAERLPAQVEAAAYFVTSEALANAVKHAHASEITIAAARVNGTLRLEVSDDGVGGADPGGNGLRGLADRVEALDGRLAVESAPDAGTTIYAEIPCAR